MKIVMPHGSGYDWDGHMVGWAPGGVVDIPDGNDKAVAWARSWLENGAELVEDVAKPQPKPSAHKPEAAKEDTHKSEKTTHSD